MRSRRPLLDKQDRPAHVRNAGRRVLQSYLFLFLHSSPSLQPEHDLDFIAERAINTYVLGEHVAPRWGIGKIVRWTPVNINSVSTAPTLRRDPSSLLTAVTPSSQRSIGMYKVHGTTVEAVMGGVFHQHVSSQALVNANRDLNYVHI